jgi:hypothetical protein
MLETIQKPIRLTSAEVTSYVTPPILPGCMRLKKEKSTSTGAVNSTNPIAPRTDYWWKRWMTNRSRAAMSSEKRRIDANK